MTQPTLQRRTAPVRRFTSLAGIGAVALTVTLGACADAPSAPAQPTTTAPGSASAALAAPGTQATFGGFMVSTGRDGQPRGATPASAAEQDEQHGNALQTEDGR